MVALSLAQLAIKALTSRHPCYTPTPSSLCPKEAYRSNRAVAPKPSCLPGQRFSQKHPASYLNAQDGSVADHGKYAVKLPLAPGSHGSVREPPVLVCVQYPPAMHPGQHLQAADALALAQPLAVGQHCSQLYEPLRRLRRSIWICRSSWACKRNGWPPSPWSSIQGGCAREM